MITNNATEADRAPYYAVLRDEDDHVKHHQALDAAVVAVQESLPTAKVYRALLTQTGENAPVATVLENTLGGEVVWTRASAGTYRAAVTGASGSFPLDKTWFPQFAGVYLEDPVGYIYLTHFNNEPDEMQLSESGGRDDSFALLPILILVFP